MSLETKSREFSDEYYTERDRILGELAALHRLHAAAPAMLECIKEAYTMAENLRKATGDAIPAAICHTLRAAIALTEPPKPTTKEP